MRKMRNFKTLTAVALAATMVMGSAMNVMAVSGDAVESEGSYEGGAMKYPRLSVTLPTVSKADYDYIADPNDLIKDTVTESGDAARYKDSQFTGTKGIFFLTTPKDENNPKNIYTEKSAAKTVTNNNAQDIKVRVKLEQGSVAGDTDVTYAASEAFSGTNKEIYLAVTDDTNTSALSSGAAAQVEATVTGTKANYEKAYDADTDSYGYKMKAEADLVDWQKCAFYLTGALNKGAKWGDNVKFPSIQVTWAYNAADPADEPQEEGPTLNGKALDALTPISYTVANQADLVIPYNLGAGSLAAEEITDVVFDWQDGTLYSVNGVWGVQTTDAITISGSSITVKYDDFMQWCNGEYKIHVIFDGDDSNYPSLTVNCN